MYKTWLNVVMHVIQKADSSKQFVRVNGDLPSEHGGNKPRQQANYGSSGFGANVPCFEWFAYGIVSFETYG